VQGRPGQDLGSILSWQVAFEDANRINPEFGLVLSTQRVEVRRPGLVL
jgi:hypothetical protein